METIMVNLVIGLATALFGAMAIFPMLLETRPARRTPFQVEDDQVISIQPVGTAPRGLHPIAQQGDTIEAPAGNHRHAA